MPPLVSASTCGLVEVRGLLASCLTDAVRRRAASLAGRIGAEVGVLPARPFWLISCSAFGATAHDEAHDAFMTLPPYSRTRDGEAPPGSWLTTLLAGPLSSAPIRPAYYPSPGRGVFRYRFFANMHGKEGRRATTRVPTLPITTPAPTGTRGLLPKKPIPESGRGGRLVAASATRSGRTKGIGNAL
jgi:hypothetical protein